MCVARRGNGIAPATETHRRITRSDGTTRITGAGRPAPGRELWAAPERRLARGTVPRGARAPGARRIWPIPTIEMRSSGGGGSGHDEEVSIRLLCAVELPL